MSSVSRGATGANKPKPVNVNSLYAGRNLAAGAKPLGKHGLTSVGKSVGVVRRMPPPATLPSLKAENNGQDPNVVVVPQGGTGWNKNETSTETSDVVKTQSSYASSGPDLRPTWAKPQSDTISSGSSSTKEFPTLAVAAQGIDASHKAQNKWATGSLLQGNETRTLTQTPSSDEIRVLPSRYYDNASDFLGAPQRQTQVSQRSRFQGSSDARMSHPNYFTTGLCENGRKLSETERSEECAVREDSQFVARSDRDRLSQSSQMSRGSDFFFDGTAPEGVQIAAEETYRAQELDRDDAIGKSRHKRTSYRSMDGEDADKGTPTETNASKAFDATSNRWGRTSLADNQRNAEDGVVRRVTKRVDKRLELEDVSDEEDDVQMTKLDKPTVRVVKRVAEANGISLDEEQGYGFLESSESVMEPNSKLSPPSPIPVPETKVLQEQPTNALDRKKPAESNVASFTSSPDSKPSGKKPEECSPAPGPAENVWAKRQEERESQEKEKQSQMPKAMQQAIEQHFPSVSEAASIKIDKDAARRPADSDFARATLRARRQQGSNDVRQLISSDEAFQRRAMPREQRSEQMREHRGQGSARLLQREERYPECEEDAHLERWNRNRNLGPQRMFGGMQGNTVADKGGHDGERLHRECGFARGTGGRRQISTRGRGTRTRGRNAVFVQPQILRRSSTNKKEIDREDEAIDEESMGQSFPVAEHDFSEPKLSYGAVGEKTMTLERTKVASDVLRGNVAKQSDSHGENVPQQEHGENGDSGRMPSHREMGMDRRHTNRWQNRAIGQRGHARRGRGGLHSHKSEYQDVHAQRRMRVVDDRGSDDVGHTVGPTNHVKGRNSYQQQRNRRKFDMDQKPRSPIKPIGQERADRLRSPVVSSEGYDEWETASESSTRVAREDRSEAVAGARRAHGSNRLNSSAPVSSVSNSSSIRRGANRGAHQNPSHGDAASPPSSNIERSRGSKNAQPASRTCQSPSASYNNSSNNKESNSRARDAQSTEKNLSDGLAGLDINNIASVVVIDDHLVDAVSVDASEEFEEVLNKRAKKQKALELQAKMEAEERRKMKEKERQARAQAKKLARQNQNAKKDVKKEDTRKDIKRDSDNWFKAAEQKLKPKEEDKKDVNSHSAQEESSKVETRESAAETEVAEARRDVPVTTVWNSAHVAEQKELLDGAPSIIPSPIARPTPRSKSAASDPPPSFQELVRRQIVELPVSLSSSQPLRADKYDFTFDPRLHEEQVSNEKVLASLSTGASSEAGSMTEDYRLKEKLYKVKGLWSGEEKETEPNLPSNVAKVKPQPQSGAEHTQNDGKPAVSVSNGCHAVPPKSPGIAPFPSGLGGLMFSPYPVMFGDMSVGRGYTSVGSVVQPLIPPSNASSPPVCPPLYQQPPSLSANPTMSQRQLPIRSSYMDQNAMFASNLPPSQNMSWNTGSMLDNVGNAAVSGTPSPQLPPAHLPSAIQPPPPNMALQHRGPPPAMPQNHSHSLARGYGMGISNLPPNGAHMPPPPPPSGTAPGTLVPPPPIPPPELMNMPPPIGTQRVPPFTIQYAGFAPPPPLTHPVHPTHNFNQPPPNVRFAQPPPPPHQDAQWEKGLTLSAGVRPQFAMFTGHSSPQMNTARPGQHANKWGMNSNHSNLSAPQIRSIKMPPTCVGRVPCTSGAVMERKSSCDISSMKSSVGQGSHGS